MPVADILGRPGAHRDLALLGSLEDVGTALARLDGPVDARLRAESVVEGVLVTGTVRAAAHHECARCLRVFSGEVELSVCELFAAPGHLTEDREVYRVTDASIDLEPMLRDALTLHLPLNPLCGPDCAGLCARCGADLNEGPCGCTDDETDPRWAALTEVRARLES